MRKTMFRWLIALAIVLPCVMLTAFASERTVTASGYCGGEGDATNLTWTLYEDGELVIEGAGAMGNYAHSSQKPWYEYSSGIKTVTVQHGVTTIGDFAFSFCYGLTKVNIPSSVYHIGYCAFTHCENLPSINIPLGVTTIGPWAFEVCESLTSVVVPNSVTQISNSAFYHCTSLKSVALPDSIVTIGSWAFESCTGLVEINIPSGVTKIDDGVFYGCTGLKSVDLHNSVRTIGIRTFNGCSSLVEINIPNSVTTIGDSAFNSCANLKTVKLGSGLETIGTQAFGNTGLTEIVIPASVTSIGERVFCYDFDLKKITVESRNRNYCVVDGVLYSSDMTTLVVCPAAKTAASYAISEGVTTIYGGAFCGNYELEDVFIPASANYIGDSAFYGCQLKQIRLNPNNKAFALVDGGLYTADRKTLVAYTVGNEEEEIHVPDGVECVQFSAVGHAMALRALCLPDSVEVIELEAFRQAANLQSVVIGAGVTRIEATAFGGCYQLRDVYYVGDRAGWKAITINNGNEPLLDANIHYVTREQLRTMKSEGDVSLSAHCAPVGAEVTVYPKTGYKLRSVSVDGRAIEGDTFIVSGHHTVAAVVDKENNSPVVASGDCGMPMWSKDLRWTMYEDGELCIGGYGWMFGSMLEGDEDAPFRGIFESSAPWYKMREQITKVTVHSGVYQISAGAFMNCTNLTEIVLPETIRTINGFFAFGCPKIATITVDERNTVFGVVDGVLYTKDMSEVVLYPATKPDTTYVMPDSVVHTWPAAFYAAENLKELVLSSNFTSVNGFLAYGCTGLTEIVIPDGVTHINGQSFGGCENLAAVLIPGSVTMVSDAAFDGCDKLVVYGWAGTEAEQFATDANVPFVPITLPAEPTGDTAAQVSVVDTNRAGVVLYAKRDCKAAVAFYDDNGKMLAMRLVDAKQGLTVHTLTKLGVASTASQCKVIFMDKKWIPIDKATVL